MFHVPRIRRKRSPVAERDRLVDELAEEFRAKSTQGSTTHTESNPQGTAQSRADELQRSADGNANTATRKLLKSEHM